MELFNSVLKCILKSKTQLHDLHVCGPFSSAPLHFAADFCAQNSVDNRPNLLLLTCYVYSLANKNREWCSMFPRKNACLKSRNKLLLFSSK